MKAHCLIRSQPWYRRDAFISGLRAAGHEVSTQWPDRPDARTLLVIWNRYNEGHDHATRVEANGGRVVVAENGYLGTGGATPKFSASREGGPNEDDYYALSFGFHNAEGSQLLPAENDRRRWDVLGCGLKPWRDYGSEIVILPNRPFGVPGRAMPPDWAERTLLKVQKLTRTRARIRWHPGNKVPKTPVLKDLEQARSVVIWSSSAGVHALLEGIPVFCEAPYWIMRSACARGSYDNPEVVEREPHFHRMAWGQWKVSEIASGIPFQW